MLRRRSRGRICLMLLEENNLLRGAIFQYLEVVLAQVLHRLSILVGDDNVYKHVVYVLANGRRRLRRVCSLR